MMNRKLFLTVVTVLTMCFCLSTAAFALDTGAQSITKIESQAGYENFIVGNETQPLFTYAHSPAGDATVIYEEVFIELPLDTDKDGKRDLVKIYVFRPKLSEADSAGVTPITLPTLIHHSPYRSSGSKNPDFNLDANHNVRHDQAVNPDTTAYTYADVETDKPRSDSWYFGAAEASWSGAAWENNNTGEYYIPAAHPPALNTVYRSTYPAKPVNLSSIYQYFFARGYAIVLSSSTGNIFNEDFSDGFTSTGNVEETVVAMAVIKWLNQDPDVRGFTDRSATTQVVATWSNGNAAMTGTSYDGTLPIATAASGVEGLKAIVPIAAISSWYDYYRGNGAVIAPFDFQGEDADGLAAYCFYRHRLDEYKNNEILYGTIRLRDAFEAYMAEMHIEQDRVTGDYSEFWDMRNYLTTVDNIKAPVLVMHGLNDTNVKTKQFDQLYRAMKASPTQTPIKVVLHVGAHASIWDRADSHYLEYFHMWLDRYLYELNNNAENIIPEVSLVNENNVTSESYDSWPIAGAVNEPYYFTNVSGYGELSSTQPSTTILGRFKDNYAAHTGVDESKNSQLMALEAQLIDTYPSVNTAAGNEVLFFAIDDLAEPMRLNGTVTVSMEVSADAGVGSLTAMLVEISDTYRTFGNTPTLYTINENVANGISMRNYTIIDTLSSYKIVTRGHADIQNPNPGKVTYLNADPAEGYIPPYYYQTKTIVPGDKNIYFFEMEPMDYTFKAGSTLALMVYSTDYRATIIQPNPTEFTLYSGANSYVNLPIVPTYSVYYDLNGGSVKNDAIAFSDTYPVAGLSTFAPDGNGYRVVSNDVTKYLREETDKTYTFAGWNALADGTGAPYVIGDRYALTGDTTIYAQWDIKTFPVEFDAAGGTFAGADQIIATISQPLGALPVVTRDGYSFTGWMHPDTTIVTSATAATNAFVDVTLTAQWTEIVPANTLSVKLGGDFAAGWENVVVNPDGIPIAPFAVYENTYFNLPVVERAGYTSIWNTAPDGTGAVTVTSESIVTSAVLADIDADGGVLFIVWIADSSQPTVKFIVDDGDPLPDMTVTHGSPYGALPTATYAGYIFEGWFTDRSYATQVTDTTVVSNTADHMLYAKWTAASYIVHFDPMGGSLGAQPDQINVTFDAAYGPLPVPQRGGYTFFGWRTDTHAGPIITEASIVTTPGEHTLYADWRSNSGIVIGPPVVISPDDDKDTDEPIVTEVEDTVITTEEKPTVKDDGSVILPDGGGTINVGGDKGVEIDAPAGTEVDPKGNVTIPDNKDAEVTLPNDEGTVKVPGGSTVDTDGTVTVGDGTADVKLPDGTEITLGEGGTVAADGTVTVGEDGTAVVKLPDGTEITLGAGSIIADGHITVSEEGGTITTPDGVIILEPGDTIPLAGNEPISLPFTDVKEEDWYHDAVAYCYDKGYFTGLSDDIFAPYTSLNRAMFVTVLWRLEGEPAAAGASAFTDVAPGTWYSTAVAWAAENDIVTGYSATTFGPTDLITREQMAVIMMRFSAYKGEDVDTTAELEFTDADTVSDWALEGVKWAYAVKLMNGRENNTFVPQGTARRYVYCPNFMQTNISRWS